MIEDNNNSLTSGVVFDWLFAAGLPLSEAYWVRARVGGVDKDVLVQAFERRIITYTPSNPAGWQVEMGNVGLHYYAWRYQAIPASSSTVNSAGGNAVQTTGNTTKIGYASGPTTSSLPAAEAAEVNKTGQTRSGQAQTISRADLSDRFGVTVTSLENRTPAQKEAGLKNALSKTGAGWWYQYGANIPDVPGAQQVQLLRVWGRFAQEQGYKRELDRLLALLKTPASQPVYWLIGNEPNTPGQDDIDPAAYARALAVIVPAIKKNRPQDVIIGPNVLNWSATCSACPGFTSGRDWVVRFNQAYQAQNGGQAAPIYIWSIHTYNLDWNKLPLINQTQDARQLEELRGYLDSLSTERGKPIWLTEFGVVWGFDGLEWQQDAQKNWMALPRGTYRSDLIGAYLEDTLGWLENNAERLNIGRWFVFSSYAYIEPFSNTNHGMALFEGIGAEASLNSFGQIYRSHLERNRAN